MVIDHHDEENEGVAPDNPLHEVIYTNLRWNDNHEPLSTIHYDRDRTFHLEDKKGRKG